MEHHWKEPRQGQRIRWHQRRRLRSTETAQVLTQAIHYPVERLVRNGLVLVAAAAEHDRLVAGHLVEELLNQRGLAYAGGTVNAHSRRAALTDRGERFRQHRQLPRAADKAWLRPARLVPKDLRC